MEKKDNIYNIMKDIKEYNVIEKRNNIISHLSISKEGFNKMKYETIHLCGNCKNAYCHKCLKVRDHKKQTLDKYTFIKKGIQSLTPNNNVYEFLVSECNNYIPEISNEKFKRIINTKKKNYYNQK